MIHLILRVPFLVWVAAATATAVAVAYGLMPHRLDVAAGVGAGVAVAGGLAALAVGVLRRIAAQAAGDQAARAMKLARGFAGLMLARMVGYVAFVAIAAFSGGLDIRAVCGGLVLGTILFQTMEIIHLRNLK